MRILLLPVCVSVGLCVGLLFGLFVWGYAPQVDFLVYKGWDETVAGVVMPFIIILETGVLTAIVFEVMWGNKEYNAFITELENRGTAERLKKDFGVDKLETVGTCANIWHTILFLIIRIALGLVTFPVTLAPAVGQLLWLYLNGWLLSWQMVSPFLGNLKITGFRGQLFHVMNHWWSYSSFGAVSLFLSLIPFVNVIFKLGSAYGLAIMFDNFALELSGESSCCCVPNYSRSVYYKDGKAFDRRSNSVVAREPSHYIRLDEGEA